MVRFAYHEIIPIRTGDKLNMIEWMAARMIDYKLDRRRALVFQPYIMALIHHKTGFLGIDCTVHRHFHPFMNKKEALEQEDSPPPIATAVREGASVWMPPMDYFVPYFEHLNHQFQVSIAPLC